MRGSRLLEFETASALLQHAGITDRISAFGLGRYTVTKERGLVAEPHQGGAELGIKRAVDRNLHHEVSVTVDFAFDRELSM